MNSPSREIRGIRWFLGRILRWLDPYRAGAALMFGALLVDLAYDSVLPLAFKFLIDDAIVPRDGRVLVTTGAALIVLCVAAGASATGRDYLYAWLSAHVLSDLRLAMYQQLQRLSMSFYSRNQAGDILARFSSDLAAVENALVLALPAGVYAALGVAAAAGILLVLEWRIALLAGIGIPLCLIGPRLIGPHAQRLSYEMKERQAALASTVQENVSAQAVVKAFGLQERAIGRFRSEVLGFRLIAQRANFLAYLMERTPNLGLMAFNLAVILAGAWLAFEGQLAIGSLVAFQLLFLNLSQSVYGVTWVIPHFVHAAAGMQRIDELLAGQPEVLDAPGARPLPGMKGTIEFRDVCFDYGGGAGGLDRVSFSIPAGSYAVFVGASGSGKSTVLNLLLRFYDPGAGAVLIDGVDLREVTQASWRAQTGVVLQESFLFNTSVRENLLLASPGASEREIHAAARAAEVHDDVLGLPGGYDTLVGERGGRLSGGQRQRIAIARALLRDPRVMVLDEATSALDPANEAAISATLEKVARGRTVVAVTHRLATAARADCIYVMDEGRLVEWGTHAALLARRGRYRSLWDKQSGFNLTQNGEWTEIDAERLRRLPVLDSLDAALIDELAKVFVTEHFAAERTVIQQGDPGDRFYVIVRGKAEVLREQDAGPPRRVATLSDGDCFGEVALLKSVPRTASVRTLTPCVLASLAHGQFLNLLDRSPGTRARLEAMLAARAVASVNPPD